MYLMEPARLGGGQRVFLGGEVAYLFLSFKILLIYFYRGREGERKGEKHQYMVASCISPTGYLASNPGMCPGWELNQQLRAFQAGTQSTEPH